LIDTSKKKDFLTLKPVIARNDIGQHHLVGVPDVWRRVRVIDRGGDEKRFRHLWGHTAQRTAVRQAHQGTTAWGAVDFKLDGWEAVTPWFIALRNGHFLPNAVLFLPVTVAYR
jgi:CO dehydrogenase/acetyl-CoA synthase delta subunit